MECQLCETWLWNAELGVITVRCGGMMRLCNKWNALPLCCVKCSVMHNVANIRCDLKCGVEYVECGVMWNVM